MCRSVCRTSYPDPPACGMWPGVRRAGPRLSVALTPASGARSTPPCSYTAGFGSGSDPGQIRVFECPLVRSRRSYTPATTTPRPATTLTGTPTWARIRHDRAYRVNVTILEHIHSRQFYMTDAHLPERAHAIQIGRISHGGCHGDSTTYRDRYPLDGPTPRAPTMPSPTARTFPPS